MYVVPYRGYVLGEVEAVIYSRWPILMVFSIFWTGTWLRQWYICAWIFALVVAGLANHTNYIVKRRYRLELELDLKDECKFSPSSRFLINVFLEPSVRPRTCFQFIAVANLLIVS